MYRHGYQSWSPCDVATVDESSGEVRSTLVTVLTDDDSEVLVGFAGGAAHDGTLRLRGAELWAEAFLGSAVLAPGEERRLHDVVVRPGGTLESFGDSLRRSRQGRRSKWAGAPGTTTSTTSPKPTCAPTSRSPATGRSTCSRSTTATSRPSATGSRRTTASRQGSRRWPRRSSAPGTAPASGSRRSSPRPTRSWLASTRPGWRATSRVSPLVGMVNEPWGGAVFVLDTTNPDVLAHLESLAADLVAAWLHVPEAGLHVRARHRGCVRATRSLTPAQRVRAGYDAIRARRRRRRVPARLRRPARPRDRCGRRHAHRPGRRAVVGTA